MASKEELDKYNREMRDFNNAQAKNKEIDAKIAELTREITKLENDIEKLEKAKYELKTIHIKATDEANKYNKDDDKSRFKGENEQCYSTKKESVFISINTYTNKINDTIEKIQSEISKRKSQISFKNNEIRSFKSSKLLPCLPIKPE